MRPDGGVCSDWFEVEQGLRQGRHTHIHTYIQEDQCEWHRMTRMTGPDCAVMCNLINTYMPPPRTPRTMVRIEATGQIYKQVQSFTYLGGAVTETPDMPVEIARRTRACWARIRRYSRELYGQPKVALSLKTRMVKAEAIEALLYGCSTWTLRQEHYAKLRTVHHRVLLRIIGAQNQTTG